MVMGDPLSMNTYIIGIFPKFVQRPWCLTARFPPPWSVDELEACLVVRSHNGQQLAYVYFEDEPQRRSAAKRLSKGEAQRMTVNIAELPELARKARPC
jgi:hypothetical protein